MPSSLDLKTLVAAVAAVVSLGVVVVGEPAGLAAASIVTGAVLAGISVWAS
jgi:hypothetical protein